MSRNLITSSDGSMAKSRKEQNLEATRAALMAVARKHFAKDGYSGAEIARIAADAPNPTTADPASNPIVTAIRW